MALPSKLFGRSTIDELGFSNYYHYSWGNRLCHATTFPLLYFSIALALGAIPYAGHYIVGSICIFFILLYLWMDLLIGIMWTVTLCGVFVSEFIINNKFNFVEVLEIAIAVGIFVTCIQVGIGHVACDHKLPAFTLFEAAIVTPFFIYYSVAYLLFNYKKSLMIAIEDATPKVPPPGTKFYVCAKYTEIPSSL